MRTKLYRTLALAVAALTLTLFTGCYMPTENSAMPKPDAVESPAPELDYEARKLTFKKNVSSAQVNIDTALGYFCYEDNPSRILTENSKSDTADDSITLSVKLKKKDGTAAVSPDEYTLEIKENGFLYINSKVLGTLEIGADCANGSSFDVESMMVTRRSISIFDYLLFAIGLYLLFAGIVGRGKIYESEFVKEGMEQKHRSIIRISCLVISLLMIASGVLTFMDVYGKLTTVRMILFALMLVVFVVALIVVRPCIDQEKKRKAQLTGGSTVHAPSAAFEFDGDEPTVDDLGENNK